MRIINKVIVEGNEIDVTPIISFNGYKKLLSFKLLNGQSIKLMLEFNNNANLFFIKEENGEKVLITEIGGKNESDI